MRIGLIAPLALPVPPCGYGGTERVVAGLADGLVALGHDVTLFATGDARTQAHLRARFPQALEGGGLGRDAIEAAERAHVAWAVREGKGFDILHDHTKTAGVLASAGVPHPPMLTTVHNAPTPARLACYGLHPTHPLVALSVSHRRGLAGLNVAGVVPNGIDVAPLPLGASRGDYMLFLGRLDAAKGADVAARLAAEADWPIIMAGRTRHDPAFFASAVAPWLDGRRRRYVGEVDGPAKWSLIAGARALLFPIRWEEPFGLVMVEAMAVGCPVVATARGAAPELIRDGVTGRLVPEGTDWDGWAAAVEAAARCQPDACRAHVEAHFGLDRMVAAYVALYEGLRDARAA